MIKVFRKFSVSVSVIGEFLGVLDPGDSAVVTYVGHPYDHYSVVLSVGTSDPDVINSHGVVAVE